jgi:ribosomal protein S21
MAKPNENFKLNVTDIDIIEQALRSLKQTQEVQKLLGKIHNQKHWYRPTDKTYVGG